jgi:NAD(P)H-nitrite reductase large subunit
MDDVDSLHPAIRAVKTICRCNNVKYRTLERVIDAGASTIAEIAAKTTATTGYCGGTCTPDVLRMLVELRDGAGKVSLVPPEEEDAWWARPMVKKNG